MYVVCEWCTYLLVTRLKSCKSWVMLVWSMKRQTLLIIIQISSGLKNFHMPRFCKYLHVKIARLAIVKSYM